MQTRADLHCHTNASDGVLPPAALVQLAAARKLDVVAITDHDTVAGVSAARDAASRLDVEVVAGVEISCLHVNKDVHVVGLFIDIDNARLLSLLECSRAARKEASIRVIKRLVDLGAPLDDVETDDLMRGEMIGRAHFARALIRAGHVASMNEAFNRFLGEGKPAYVSRERPTVSEACEVIHEAGGVAALAHPGGKPGLLSKEAVQSMALDGIDAVEAYHPAHDKRTVTRVKRWAASMGLLITGGSDFHGPGEGADLGVCFVGAEELEMLRSKAASY